MILRIYTSMPLQLSMTHPQSSQTESTAIVGRPIRVLLTVPHLNPTASPWRETMSLARYLDRNRFHLTICALRDGGWSETQPLLEEMGVPAFCNAVSADRKDVFPFLEELPSATGNRSAWAL